MQISQLANNIVQEHKRYDQAHATLMAVMSAIRKIHSEGKFEKDLSELVIPLDNLTMITDSEFSLALPPESIQFIRVPYLLQAFNAANQPQDLFKTTHAEILAKRSTREPFYNSFFVYGESLRGQLTTEQIAQTTIFKLAYYAMPEILDETFSNWLTRLYPDAISAYAKFLLNSIVFKDAESRRNTWELFSSQLADIKAIEEHGE